MKNIDEMTGKEIDEIRRGMEGDGSSPVGYRRFRLGEKRDWLKRVLARDEKPAVSAEKVAWGKRKAEYYALKAKYAQKGDGVIVKSSTGAFVNKPRAVQFLAGQKKAALPDPMTRQCLRATVRSGYKALLHETKMSAMRDKTKGGAASVRAVLQQ